MTRLLLVCLGSGIGGGLRYLFGNLMHRILGASFPYGTLGVNIVGSFLIMVIMYMGLNKGLLSAEARLFLTTGVMGGLTTYSAFSYETMTYLEQKALGMAFLNISVTLLLCLLASALGMVVARWLA